MLTGSSGVAAPHEQRESKLNSPKRYAWLWDVPMSNEEFDALVAGGAARGGYDQAWAVLRLIEYAPWREIQRRLPREVFLQLWPALRTQTRSAACREGMDFLYERWRTAQ